MKLVGDSKFIAEAYQKIYEDDFMSGMDEYERLEKETFYIFCMQGTQNIERYTFATLRRYIHDHFQQTIKQAVGLSEPEILKAFSENKFCGRHGGYPEIYLSKNRDQIEKVHEYVFGQGDDGEWFERNYYQGEQL